MCIRDSLNDVEKIISTFDFIKELIAKMAVSYTHLFGWFLTACICFGLLPSLIITNISKATRMIKGTFHNYPYAEINNTHMIISARGNSADNTIYIPIEKILKIELGKKQKRTYGDINVFVEGKNKQMCIRDR